MVKIRYRSFGKLQINILNPITLPFACIYLCSVFFTGIVCSTDMIGMCMCQKDRFELRRMMTYSLYFFFDVFLTSRSTGINQNTSIFCFNKLDIHKSSDFCCNMKINFYLFYSHLLCLLCESIHLHSGYFLTRLLIFSTLYSNFIFYKYLIQIF